jgi:hypothetical protein
MKRIPFSFLPLSPPSPPSLFYPPYSLSCTSFTFLSLSPFLHSPSLRFLAATFALLLLCLPLLSMPLLYLISPLSSTSTSFSLYCTISYHIYIIFHVTSSHPHLSPPRICTLSPLYCVGEKQCAICSLTAPLEKGVKCPGSGAHFLCDEVSATLLWQ